jgi:hypothetical protein
MKRVGKTIFGVSVEQNSAGQAFGIARRLVPR